MKIKDSTEQRGLATRLSRSSMLEGYLASITELLQAGRHEEAERAALALPHIAVALSDAQLQSSPDAYRAWCAEWVRMEPANGEYDEWSSKAAVANEPAAPGVPFNALRALRLHRHTRPNSRGVAMSHDVIEQDEGPVTTLCLTLMAATLRWYSRSAVSIPQVQANLARLGVLH
jgi:hypothetical protein